MSATALTCRLLSLQFRKRKESSAGLFLPIRALFLLYRFLRLCRYQKATSCAGGCLLAILRFEYRGFIINDRSLFSKNQEHN
jgi:hypothetical protein